MADRDLITPRGSGGGAARVACVWLLRGAIVLLAREGMQQSFRPRWMTGLPTPFLNRVSWLAVQTASDFSVIFTS